MSQYSELSLAELRALAKERKIGGYSTLRKSELVDLLSQGDSAPAESAVVVAEPAKEKTPAKSNADSEAAEPVRRPAPAAEKSARKPASDAAPGEGRPARKPVSDTTPDAVRRPSDDAAPVAGRRPQEGAAAVSTPGTGSSMSVSRAPQGTIVRRTVGSGAPTRSADNRDARAEAQGSGERRAMGNSDRRMPNPNGTDPTDSGIIRRGIFEICSDNYGFLRNDNYLPSEQDVYINPSMIRRYNLSTGDVVEGTLKVQTSSAEKFVPLHHITKINDKAPELAMRRRRFDRLTPVFPHERLHLEYPGCEPSVRMVDMFSPIGKGQRGMIVSQPKAGKTTLLKQIARSILTNHKSVHMIILLIDERPEEVTDFKEFVQGTSAEVIYSTFDEEPNRHRRVSEMTMERAKRLVEYGEDVVILLDSITRLARAYNLTCVSSGRTLSGGLDPNALFMPKKFFGAARCMKEGGSLTILATALVDTGSRMDDVVYEEFKGTGNMELVLNRDLSERRIFPAIDLPKSSTRREDLLLNEMEQRANVIMRRAFNGKSSEDSVEQIINLFSRTRTNFEFMQYLSRTKLQ